MYKVEVVLNPYTDRESSEFGSFETIWDVESFVRRNACYGAANSHCYVNGAKYDIVDGDVQWVGKVTSEKPLYRRPIPCGNFIYIYPGE